MHKNLYCIDGYAILLTIDEARALRYEPLLPDRDKESLARQIEFYAIEYAVWG